MIKVGTAILILLLSSLAAPADAAELWTPAFRHWALKNYHLPMQDPAAATTWNAMRGRLHSILGFDDPGDITIVVKRRTAEVLPEKLRSGKLPYLMGTKKSNKVMIVFPGIFSNLDGNGPVKRIRNFSKKGYQTIYFPNPLSTDFIGQKPQILPGAIFEESEVFYGAILQLIQDGTILPGATIEVFGESYGAILGAAFMKIDRAGLNIINRATLICPSLDMQASERVLDRNMELYEPLRVPIGLHQFSIFFHYAFAKKQSDLPKFGWASVKNARAVVFVLGFQQWLYDAGKFWKKVFNLNAPLRHDITFERFDDEFVAPVMPFQERKLLRLDQVVSQLKADKKIRILATADDLINEGNTFAANNLGAFDNENLILLPKGGHLGFTSMRWYRDFLNKAFQ